MMDVFIKYVSVLVCGHYTFYKLLNLKPPAHKQYSIHSIYIPLMSLCMYWLRIYVPYFSTLILLLCSCIFLKWITGLPPLLSVPAAILSFGYSFIIMTLSAMVSASILCISSISDEIKIYLLFPISAIVIFSVMWIPFKFKRLNKGMPFLKEQGTGNTGILTCVFIFCVIIYLNNENLDLTFQIIFIFIPILSSLLFIWWRRQIKNFYQKKIKKKNFEELQNSLIYQETEIEKLKESNDTLAKIIHKDNKLIPAMEFSVKSFLQSFDTPQTAEQIQKQGQALTRQLEEIARERSGILTSYESQGKILPKTNVKTLDSMMLYMYSRAKTANIDFDLTISGNIKFMAEHIIQENDLTTLLSDFIENAMLAITACEKRHILVNLGIHDQIYFIEIADSGIAFEPEILVQLGNGKITTRRKEGGSGIGLSNAFSLFRKYKASFIIEEFDGSKAPFTKKLTVQFDGQCAYIIQTPRGETLQKTPYKNEILIQSTKNSA